MHGRGCGMMGGWQSVALNGKDVGVDQYSGLILLALPLLLLYFVYTRTKRQQRVQLAIQASLRPGQRVMTTSGLHGTLVSVDESSTVVLEIAPGVSTRWARPAIAQILDDDAAPVAQTDPEAVLDLTSSPNNASLKSSPDNQQDDQNDLRSDDDRDNRTLT
jgi:preprotein translocase subunit YajC